MSLYPPFEEIIRGEDKTRLLEIRRSFRSIISNMFLFAVTALLVYLINAAFYDSGLPLLGGLSPRWLSIIPALVLLEILRKYHDDLYIFGNHRVSHYQGRLSLKTTVPSLKYVDILAVRVKQDIWGRVFDYGNVELDTAASSAVELTMRGVRAPAEITDIIDGFRRYSERAGSIDNIPKSIESGQDSTEPDSEAQPE